jgi:hypothetical protein
MIACFEILAAGHPWLLCAVQQASFLGSDKLKRIRGLELLPIRKGREMIALISGSYAEQ